MANVGTLLANQYEYRSRFNTPLEPTFFSIQLPPPTMMTSYRILDERNPMLLSSSPKSLWVSFVHHLYLPDILASIHPYRRSLFSPLLISTILNLSTLFVSGTKN